MSPTNLLMDDASRVDKDKGYIDLSKRRVSSEDIERCTEVFSKAKVKISKAVLLS